MDEESFARILRLERKRTERSRKQFVVMLLKVERVLQTDRGEGFLEKIVSALSSSIRETDVKGWYEENRILGVIFAELGVSNARSALPVLRARTATLLRNNLDGQEITHISISLYVYPEDRDKGNPTVRLNPKLYPDLVHEDRSARSWRLVKRAMDIVGSAAALVLLSPLVVLIGLAIRLTSKGPVLFRQERVCQYGEKFSFLKFRSMYFDSKPTIHKEYAKRFISGEAVDNRPESSRAPVFKLTDDPRVTPVGRFLRMTSLDELPQFWNVFKGDMSLVGPRPPLPYEFESYDIWHRCRVWDAKPGITGLWQVNGRSRTSFDDMVRLDLRYAKACSIWLDLKILLQTPRAILFGGGAY